MSILVTSHSFLVAQVAAMLRGEPAPWETGGSHSSLQMTLGRKFFMARNDLDRCLEQLQEDSMKGGQWRGSRLSPPVFQPDIRLQ
eukprot:472088-Pelagomonas_calceolata.AAC.1